MFRCLGLVTGPVLAVLLLGGALQAQEKSLGASDALIEKTLEGLDLRFTNGVDGYAFKLGERAVMLQRLGKGAKLLIKAPLEGPAPALATLNGYNEQVAVTTRAVHYAKLGVVLEAGLDCRAGVTPAMLRQFVSGFGQEIRDFEKFVAEAPPAAPAGENSVVPVQGKPIPVRIAPGSNDKEVEIQFPTQASATETAWKITWDMQTGKEAAAEGFNVRGRADYPVLFKIKKAYFRPGAKAGWVQVLENAHPSEFYVPYFFQFTRFYDLRDVGVYANLNAREGGPRSRLLGKGNRVMAEVRDRGIVYKHGATARRGEELVLWANFQAGNYTYLVEFCFHDDGTVAFKHAPTGYNFFEHFDAAAHMHNCLWRIGVKLAPADQGKANNQVAVVKLPYDPKRLGTDGKLDLVPMKDEGFHDWEAREFTRVRVTNPDYSVFPESATRPKLPISYDLVPLTQGMARHLRNKDEAFSLHDFWVTRPDSSVKMYIKLPEYFAKNNGQPLDGADGVVLWHMSSVLHVPRAEDGIYAGNALGNGQALASWTTLELRPRNLFVSTPLYRRAK